MFLTRKQRNKIRLLIVAYFLFGVVCFAAYYGFGRLEMEANLLYSLGAFSVAFGTVLLLLGNYGEGTGKLVRYGDQMVNRKLQPAQYIRRYQEKRDCPDNVIAKPDFSVLVLLASAYGAVGDKDGELRTLEELYAAAPPKKKTYAKLLKAASLYDAGETEVAERLYTEAIGEKMDAFTRSAADMIVKSDRAMAYGDYATAEAYYKRILSAAFPKPAPLIVVTLKFHLAKICLETDRREEAKEYLSYCVENGGETGMKNEANCILQEQFI